MNLKDQRAALLKAARSTANAAQAAGRDLTDDEVRQIDAVLADVKELDAKIDAAAKSAASLARLAATNEDQDSDGDEDGPRLSVFSLKHAGQHIARRLMTGERGDGRKAMPIGTAQTIDMFPGALKGLTVGEHRDPEPIGDGRRQDTIFDILPVVSTTAPAWTYRRADVRELNAQIVGEGELKPTSRLEFKDHTNRLSVFATIAGPISEQTLADYPALSRFVSDELMAAIRLRIEDQVFAGTGEPITATGDPEKVVGQNFAGILNTTGVLDQEYTGDGLGTIALATTRLESDGFAVSGIAIHPDDWVTLATTRNSSGGFDLGGAVDPAAKTIWGHPVRLTRGLPKGTALAVSNGAGAIRAHAHGMDIRAITIGDDAARNQARLRVEGRFAFDLYRPGGFCTINLTEQAAG